MPNSCTEGGTIGNTWASGMRKKLMKARRAMAAGASFLAGTLVPVAQPGEGDAGILADAQEAEAGDGEDHVDVLLFVLEIMVGDLPRHGQGLGLGRCRTAG